MTVCAASPSPALPGLNQPTSVTETPNDIQPLLQPMQPDLGDKKKKKALTLRKSSQIMD